jgi:hypothetical protein
LQPPERNIAPYDRELLALIHALLTWKHLIAGAKLTVHTDQHALKYLLSSPTRTSRQERWLAEIMCFMPDIKYIKGTDNVVADALSRRADLAALTVLGLALGILEGMREGTSKDLAASRLLAQGTLVDRGGLYYTHDTDKLYVPEFCGEGVLS